MAKNKKKTRNKKNIERQKQANQQRENQYKRLFDEAETKGLLAQSELNRPTPQQLENLKSRLKNKGAMPTPMSAQEYRAKEEIRKTNGANKNKNFNVASASTKDVNKWVKSNRINDNIEAFDIAQRSTDILEKGLGSYKFNEEQAKRIAGAEKQVHDLVSQIGLPNNNRYSSVDEISNNFKGLYTEMSGDEMKYINNHTGNKLKDTIQNNFNNFFSKNGSVQHVNSHVENSFRSAVDSLGGVDSFNTQNLQHLDKYASEYKARANEIFDSFEKLDVNNNIKKMVGKERGLHEGMYEAVNSKASKYFAKNVTKNGDVLGQVINALEDGSSISSNNAKSIVESASKALSDKELKLDMDQVESLITRSYRGGSANSFLDKISKHASLDESTVDKVKFLFTETMDKEGKNIVKAKELMDKGVKADKVFKEELAGSLKLRPSTPKLVSNSSAKNTAKKELKKFMNKSGANDATLRTALKGRNAWAMFGTGVAALSAVSDFKEGRKEGKTMLGSAADAAFAFVEGEILGIPGMLLKGGASLVGTGVTKGLVGAQQMSRSMNNMQRFAPFADMQFQDNQQLATMRQSGMELAKMSNYNLQQTLMGTEARNLHR